MRYDRGMVKPPRKHATSFRLSETARTLLKTFQQQDGNSAQAVIERLLRDEARRRGVPIPEDREAAE